LPQNTRGSCDNNKFHFKKLHSNADNVFKVLVITELYLQRSVLRIQVSLHYTS